MGGGWQIFFWILGALLAGGSFVMALARTPPNDAITNLAKWAEWARIHDLPGWLRDRAAAAIAYQWAKRVVTTASIAIICGLIVFFRASPAPAPVAPTPATTQSPHAQLPPIPFSDDEVHGWLKPANYPTPPNGCDGSIGEDAIKILIGDNGIARTGYGRIIALRIGVCDALSIEQSPEGVFIDAELNDGSGSPPVRIKKNEIFAQNGETYSARQTRDSSSITVKDNFGRVILEAKFLNPTTLKVSGIFGCTGGRSVPVHDEQPIPGFFMRRSCIANSPVGIYIN